MAHMPHFFILHWDKTIFFITLPDLLLLRSIFSMAASATSLSTFSSLSIPTPRFSLLNPPTSLFNTLHISPHPSHSLTLSKPTKLTPIKATPTDDEDTTYFQNPNPEGDLTFDPPETPEGYTPPPAFDEFPIEDEDAIAAAYEELYGPAYSGVTVLGNDVYVMDAKVKKATGFGSKTKKEKVRDGFDEKVIQVRRVTKVVKGGKQLHFRAIVVVGDKQGRVGVGVGKAKEVVTAVQKSAVNARRNIVTVPMTKYLTFPHRY